VADLLHPGAVDQRGRFCPDRGDLFTAELASLSGKRVVLWLKQERTTRSLAQNRYMWAVYGEAVAESVDLVELATGLPVFKDRAAVHGFAKLNLLKHPVMTNRGEINLLGTTTTLSTGEHATYTEALFAKLAFYGVEIPEYGGR
jgi:hypothetical protein